MTYTITISTWWNYNRGDGLAFSDAPELGTDPHAEAAMKHMGISYVEAVPSPITDSWTFYGCDKIPDPVPRWMNYRLSQKERE